MVLAADRHLEDHAVPAAVLGNVGDPQRDGVRRRVDRHRPAAEPDLARVGRRQAEEDPRQLGPARADQPGQAEDLAGTDAASRRHARPTPRQPSPRTSSTTSPGATAILGKTADSSRPTIIRISSPRDDLGHVPGPDQHAVAQGRHAVGDLRQLLQPVRDVDDPRPPAPSARG